MSLHKITVEIAADEAIYLVKVRARLRAGPATTHDLAHECGVVGRRYYHRFRKVLRPENGIVKHGEAVGPTGHLNIVWAIAGPVEGAT